MESLQIQGSKLIQPFINSSQFDFWAQQFGSTLAWERCFARVVQVRSESVGTKTLKLKANRNWSGFEAGQHCNVTATIGGRNITRSYSLSSAPANNRFVEITVRREEGGRMSSYLCDNIRPGDRIELGVPFGEMQLPACLPKHLLLMAAGSGITPFISQIRSLALRGMPTRVTLMSWVSQADLFCFRQELESNAREFLNFNPHFITTGENHTELLHGRLCDAQLDSVLNVEVADKAFACGANGFVKTAQQLCAARNIEFDSESFTPAVSAVVTEKAEHTVYLSRSRHSVQVSNQLPLLDQLEKVGVSIPSGCRQGICNTCVCSRNVGTTTDYSSGLTDSEPGQQIRLCVSRANGDLELNI